MDLMWTRLFDLSGSTCDKRSKLGSSGGYRCLGTRLLLAGNNTCYPFKSSELAYRITNLINFLITILTLAVQECEAGLSEERVESDQLEIRKRSLWEWMQVSSL